MDEQLKKDFEAVVHDLGFNMTTAFTAFAKSVVRHDALPSEVVSRKTDPFYSKQNMAALRESLEQYKRGEVRTFSSIEEAQRIALEELGRAR